MLKIVVPEGSETEAKVSLGDVTYTFIYKYNSTSESYHLDIYLDTVPVITSVRLCAGALLLRKHALDEFSHGDLMVIKYRETSDPVNRSNLGIGKPYELVYISKDELSRAGVS